MKALLLFLVIAFFQTSAPIPKERLMGGYRSLGDSSLLTLHITRGADTGNFTHINIHSNKSITGKWVDGTTAGSDGKQTITLFSKKQITSYVVNQEGNSIHLRPYQPSVGDEFVKISGTR